MVSQRNKAHKQRFRSKGARKELTKGKKVKDNFGALRQQAARREIATTSQNSRDVEMKPAKSTTPAISSTGRVQKRRNARSFIDGVIRVNEKDAEEKSAENTRGAFRDTLPRSHRTAALIPLNAGSMCAKTVSRLRECHSLSANPQDTQTMQTIVHNGCSLTLLNPFAAYADGSAVDTSAVDFAAVLDTLLVADMLIFVVNLDNTSKMMDTQESKDNRWFTDLGIEIDALGRHAISLVNAIGAPSIFVDFQFAENASKKDAQRFQSLVKLHKRYLCSVLPPKQLSLTTVYHNSATKAGGVKLWRALHETKLITLKWKESRPYMLVDWHVVVPKEGEEGTANGTLLASGYLRGAPLCPQQAVTLSGADTRHFQMQWVSIAGTERILNKGTAEAENASKIDAADSELIQRHPAEESNSENEIDENAESSENEMEVDDWNEHREKTSDFSGLDEEAIQKMRSSKRKMQLDETSVPHSTAMSHSTNISKILKPSYRLLKVPQGVSGYQAAWYDYDENLIESARDDETPEVTFQPGKGNSLSESNLNRSFGNDSADEYFSDEVSEDDPNALEPVRQRFFKYRPLPSAMMPSSANTSAALGSSALSGVYTNKFNARGASSYWDPYQNLPETYAKLRSQPLADFRQSCKLGMGAFLEKHTQNKQLDTKEVAMPGQRITVAIADFSTELQQRLAKRSPITLSGLLPNEDKLSLLHTSLIGLQHRMFEPEGPEAETHELNSKDSMVFHVGFRRYSAKGMFYSDHAMGHEGVLRVPTTNENLPDGHPNQKVMETIHQRRATYCKSLDLKSANGVCVAHFGLLTHVPTPVVILQKRSHVSAEAAAMGESQEIIVSTGRALPPDPHMLILKQRRLIGKIYKVHQRAAVIKKMFLDDHDVKYFDKVELRTLKGVKGSIVKSIGTHGTFKAKFSAVVQQHDKVYIDLFKRVFPPGYGRAAEE